MIAWLTGNLGTILVVAVLTGLVALIIRSLTKGRKAGKHVCGGDCGHCASCGACRQKN